MRIFGPVPSRRLGNSLGIDLCPYKTCTYDCIYCELGRTTRLTIKRRRFFSVEEILKDFKTVNLKNVDYITFTASGEPTLYKGIDKVLERVKKITDIPKVLLTNGSLFFLKSVRREVSNFDIIMPNLDAVKKDTFLKINRPHHLLELKEIINGLKLLRKEYKGKIFLEILFVKGFNDTDEEIKEMKRVIEYLSPDRVQLNTVYRVGVEKYARALNREELYQIKNYFGKSAEVVGEYKKKKEAIIKKRMIEEIIKHRPITLSDLKKLTGLSSDKISSILLDFFKENKIVRKGRFYVWKFNN